MPVCGQHHRTAAQLHSRVRQTTFDFLSPPCTKSFLHQLHGNLVGVFRPSLAFSMAAIASSQESEFTRTLRNFEKNLTDEQRDDFKFSTLDDLRATISTIQSKQGSERNMRNFTRMRAFLEAIEQYGKVIEVFANSSIFVAFIWVRLAPIYQIIY